MSQEFEQAAREAVTVALDKASKRHEEAYNHRPLNINPFDAAPLKSHQSICQLMVDAVLNAPTSGRLRKELLKIHAEELQKYKKGSADYHHIDQFIKDVASSLAHSPKLTAGEKKDFAGLAGPAQSR